MAGPALHELGHVSVACSFGIPIAEVVLGEEPSAYQWNIAGVRIAFRPNLISLGGETRATVDYVDIPLWQMIPFGCGGFVMSVLIASTVFWICWKSLKRRSIETTPIDWLRAEARAICDLVLCSVFNGRGRVKVEQAEASVNLARVALAQAAKAGVFWWVFFCWGAANLIFGLRQIWPSFTAGGRPTNDGGVIVASALGVRLSSEASVFDVVSWLWYFNALAEGVTLIGLAALVCYLSYCGLFVKRRRAVV